ncbi:MAG TPA: hypothetical protein EYP90_03030 [Chromatiaceae bacterium]|nr:hypothetical protein [Chromatiaceae bacterium]
MAAKIIAKRPDAYLEKNAKLLMGLARLDIHAQSYQKAFSHLRQAETIIREKELDWWLPVVLHFTGTAHRLTGDDALAREQFLLSLSAIRQNGCPDYKPLTLLNLAQLTPNRTKQEQLLRDCVSQARQRARLLDKITCLEMAGRLFGAMGHEKLKQERQNLINEAQRLQNRVQMP